MFPPPSGEAPEDIADLNTDEPVAEEPLRLHADVPVTETPVCSSVSARLLWVRYAGVSAIFISLVFALTQALARSAYGLAIATLVILGVFLVTVTNARATIRAGVAVLSIAAMAFIASASTLPYVLDTVVNAGRYSWRPLIRP